MADDVSTYDPGCVFCAIVHGEAPAEVVAAWPGAIAIVPLNPVTEGHVLLLPRAHVADATEDPMLTGYVMSLAACWPVGAANLITSIGPAATQTVEHLHVHVVPRAAGDGLKLPWTDQRPPGTSEVTDGR